MNLEVCLATVPGWRRIDLDGRVLWITGPLAESLDTTTLQRLQTLKLDDASQFLRKINTHFALILATSDWSMAAVDQVRSIPLLYQKQEDTLKIATRLAELSTNRADIDQEQAQVFATSGFTIGAKTLYKSITPLIPGQYLIIENGKSVNTITYAQFRPYEPQEQTDDALKLRLKAEHEAVIERLIQSAQGRTVLVPLSAGYDSRFVVSGLKEAGYQNVVCFAYGLDGNREAITSKAIAEKLNYRWLFVPYSNRKIRAHEKSVEYKNFIEHSDCGTSIPFRQDHAAISSLIEDFNVFKRR